MFGILERNFNFSCRRFTVFCINFGPTFYRNGKPIFNFFPETKIQISDINHKICFPNLSENVPPFFNHFIVKINTIYRIRSLPEHNLNNNFSDEEISITFTMNLKNLFSFLTIEIHYIRQLNLRIQSDCYHKKTITQ